MKILDILRKGSDPSNSIRSLRNPTPGTRPEKVAVVNSEACFLRRFEVGLTYS